MPNHNLPHQSTTFVGRSDELSEIAALLADPACRLLTIFGAGGIGKTRLALQSAADQLPCFTHGVYFIPLAPVTSSDQIAAALAGALDVTLSTTEAIRVQITRFLRDKHILLLFDNFEHLLDGVGLLSEILQSAPTAKLLVTSRERLNLHEEWALPLDGLHIPDDVSATPLAEFSAVQLFVQRARQAQPQFSLAENAKSVKTICRRVEGMPLALELAASWLRAMPSDQIAAYIAQNIDFLTTSHRNVPERQRSLRAVFQQSWNMLSEVERGVMARLTIFRGGFDLEATVVVADATPPLLAGLVDKSLIRLNPAGRYDLHELLRQFAAESLNAGDTAATLNRHFDYYLMLAQQTEAHQFGRDQVAWFDRMEVELDNLRLALTWSLQHEQAEAGIRLFTALGWFLCERCHWNEGLMWFERLLAANLDLPPALWSKAFHSAGPLAGMLGDHTRAESYLGRALEIARQINDSWNIAWSLTHFGLYASPDRVTTARAFEESIALFREIDDPMGISHTLIRRVFLANQCRDYSNVRPLLDEALAIAQKAGDKIIIGWVFCCLGDMSWIHEHDLEQTKAHYTRSIALFREARFYNTVISILIMQGHVERLLGNDLRAQGVYEEAFQLIERNLSVDIHPALYSQITTALAGLAGIAGRKGQLRQAATLLGAVSQYDMSQLAESYFEIVTFPDDVAAVRAQFDEHEFEQAWLVGQTMTRDQMLAYARSLEFVPDEIRERAASQPLIEPLTPRELEILHLLSEGLTNAEIAQKLFLASGTVKLHVSHVLGKLNVSNRTQAVTQAQKLNLLALRQ